MTTTITAIVIALAFASNIMAQSYEVEIYRLEGDAAPGSGANFQTFDRPNINGGVIAFACDTDAASGDDAVYVNDVLIAQEGTAAPGSGGLFSSFEFFESSHQNDGSNALAYITTLTATPGGNRAIYSNQTLIALEGNAAPGIVPADSFSDFGFASQLVNGDVGFLAELDVVGEVIYRGDVPLFVEGDLVPAAVPGFGGGLWSDLDEVIFNGAGSVIFEGTVDVPSNNQGVFLFTDANGLELVIREGDAVAANTGPDIFELVLQLALADSGLWLIRGNLGVAPSTADAVILDANGVVAQQGDAIDELAGAVLGNFNAADINSDGDVVYLADIEGALNPEIDEGIFINGVLIVTTGQQVPGLPDGVLFTDLGFEDVFIDDNDEVVFAASYNDDVGIAEDGLFLAVPEGPAPILFRRGDVDHNGSVNPLLDGLYLLNFTFVFGSPEPPCLAEADVSGDGSVSGLLDGLYLLNFGFAGGPPPPPPTPNCGEDPQNTVSCDAADCL